MEEKREVEHANDVHHGEIPAEQAIQPVQGHENKLSADYHNYIDKPTVEVSYTQEEANKVIRKLDWHLMPLIFVLYSLSVLDRANLGNAR